MNKETLDGPEPSTSPDPSDKSSVMSRRGDTASVKQDRLLYTKELCKELCPIPLEKLLSKIEIRLGLSRQKARGYMMLLYDDDFVDIGADNIVKLRGAEQ